MLKRKGAKKKRERVRGKEGSREEEDGERTRDEGGRSDICDKVDLLPFKMKRVPNF